LSFSVPPVSSGEMTNLVGPSLELVDSEEDDRDFWGVEDGECWGGDGEEGDFPYPLGDSPCHPFGLRFDGEPCEGIDVTLEATPQKVKGRRELLNLECSINYDA
jgi:hypothetical protein